MKKIISVMLLMTLIISGCSKQEKKEETKKPAAPETKQEVKETPEKTNYENPIATIEFEGLGIMTFELQINDAPQSVYNFTKLANDGYYNGLTMHRIVEDFVAQGGDPDGTGAGGPGYSIKGEFKSNGVANPTEHKLGAIAFARSQAPDSAGSQFYIVLSEYDAQNMARMNKDYAAFGYLLSGEDIIEQINEEYATKDGNPKQQLIVKSVSVDTLGQDIPEPNYINK